MEWAFSGAASSGDSRRRAVEAFQSVLLYGMSHDGTVVAVVPVLVIRMLTDGQPALRCGARVLPGSTRTSGARCGARRGAKGSAAHGWTEARVCTLLLNNVGGKLCLDLKLHGAFHAAAHGGGREREIPARARRREENVS